METAVLKIKWFNLNSLFSNNSLDSISKDDIELWKKEMELIEVELRLRNEWNKEEVK